MSDDWRRRQATWPRDPMGRPYDPYRGHDDNRGRDIPDRSGYAPGSGRRGTADDGYRWDEYERRDHATDQYRPHDRGHLGAWDWRQARPGEVEGDYGRGYGNRDNGTYRRDDKYGPTSRPPARPGRGR